MDDIIIKFIKGQDFLRLGQAISHHQWQAAAMTVRRMEQQVKNPGLEGFMRPLAGIRQAIMCKDEREAKQIMANITAKRVRLLEQLRCEREAQEAIISKDQRDVSIRTAVSEDLKDITEVEAACFPPAEAASEQVFAARLSVYADHFWLLEKDGELVSFVNGMVTDEPDLADEMYSNASMHKENGKWQMIFGVNTLPQYRRQGLAEQVLNRVIADAREQGREGLVLTCKEHMIHYYAKFGFVNEGLSESVHGDAVWYQMRLRF